ncbi:YidC/Oxa1 family membrane protein insertase [Candidatus Collierbacteria bacterium]|nr:YidC/Oxa1 family membrane protein insertase [Candidatus Collierbacteria bacterium]
MPSFFTIYIYQPFFNILLGLYWLVGFLTGQKPDMGIAVILFAFIVRIIMLPLTLAADRTEAEKRNIVTKIDEIKKLYKHDPLKLKTETRKVFKGNPGAVVSEAITIFIQFIIILMLYRIFKTGLEGEDLHLIYDFMPSVSTPINLMFLGEIDLSKSHMGLNFIQSSLIFIFEALHMLFSPLPTSRKEFITLGIFLPIVSFIIFALLPAGKKVFIITSLAISIFILLVKQLTFWYHSLTGAYSTAPVKEPSQ